VACVEPYHGACEGDDLIRLPQKRRRTAQVRVACAAPTVRRTEWETKGRGGDKFAGNVCVRVHGEGDKSNNVSVYVVSLG